MSYYKNTCTQSSGIVIYTKPKKHYFISSFLKLVNNFLAILGLFFVGGLLFFYIQGQQATDSLNDEFFSFFGNFVEQVLKKDIASAMLIKTPLEKGVTTKQAILAIKKHATQLDWKFITHSPLSEKSGDEHAESLPFVATFELFTANAIAEILGHNPDFAAYLPYRIAMYKDYNGQIWLATLNIELLFQGVHNMDYNVKLQAWKIQENLLKIMGASAHGIL